MTKENEERQVGMNPNDGFTDESKKRYKALRKTLEKMETPEGVAFLAGRQRRSPGPSDVVYIEARATSERGTHLTRRFYVESYLTPNEVAGIVGLLCVALRHDAVFWNETIPGFEHV